MELPPRARRIPPRILGSRFLAGTTSACAENTASLMNMKRLARNYLRVRGEYPVSAFRQIKGAELPPRARRIPRVAAYQRRPRGTTSACAENTFQHSPFAV